MMRLGWPALVLFGLALLVTPAATQDKKHPVVVMETSMGTIKIELYEDKAPETVKNFLKYVEDEHYDNMLYHRVIKDFMIQGGGYSAKDGKPKATRLPIKNESTNGLSNTRGTIAMARTSDPDSAADQFFINVVDNPRLDRKEGAGNEGYCVFGRVIEGIDVVDKIRNVDTDNRDMPVKQVVIKRVRLVKQ
jgi:peptidyl-prolyl cis-trans isomerase B (cyclophilin B)